MKRLFSIFLVLVMLCGLLPAAMAEVAFTPGTYQASAQGNNDLVHVEVTFTDAKIETVTVTEHAETPGLSDPAIEKIPAAIVDNQSLAVDTIGGATVTSKAILAAVADCVKQAGADPEELMVEVEKEAVAPTGDRTVHADILIIGGGGAGLVSAVSAIDSGADPSKVVLVEKLSTFGGTSAMSGAVLTGPTTRYLKSTGFEYSEEQWMDAWMDNVKGYIDLVGVDPGYPEKERVEIYISNLGPDLDWLEDQGFVKWTYYRSMPGTDFVIPEAIVDENGNQAFVGGHTITNPMVDRLTELGADLRLNTAGTELLVDETGKVIGAVVTDEYGSYNIYAEKGVVLATGGYSRNEELLKEFSPAYVNWISFDTASVGDTGDGINMARKIGAAMYENGAIISVGTGSANKTAGGFANFMTAAQRMMVNDSAKRFVNEGADYYSVSLRIDEQNNGDAWAIMGSNVAGSEALDAEVDGAIVVSAPTIEELAAAMGVDPDALKTSVEAYNAACVAGSDPEFGKAVTADMVIEGDKYYAFKVGVTMAGTIGGVKTDADCRVLKADGTPIEGLWAGGCVSNRSIMGYTYMHGAGFGYAIVSGRIIGQRIMGK